MNRKPQNLLLLVLVVVWTVYTVAVGGDVLHAYRFFLPILPLIAILAWRGMEEWK